MRIIEKTISITELKAMAEQMFGNLVKAVVDAHLSLMAVDAELLDSGSQQADLWGINLYPEFDPLDAGFVEFDSMINLRPSQGNRSRGVDSEEIRQRIISVVRKAVVK